MRLVNKKEFLALPEPVLEQLARPHVREGFANGSLDLHKIGELAEKEVSEIPGLVCNNG